MKSVASILKPSRAPGTSRNLHRYRLFDFWVETNLALPLAEQTSPGKADFQVRIDPDAELKGQGFGWFHHWYDTAGHVTMAGARRGGEYLLRFPDTADFHVLASLKTIHVFPAPGTSASALAHLLMDQVIPRVLNQQGRLVVHASAVALKQGKVVAFLGNTGQGKSTLVSSFFSAGYRPFADDCLLLCLDGDEPIAWPAYSSLRLWPDSVHSMFPNDTGFQPIVQQGEKQQIIFTDSTEYHGPVRLAALFILSVPGNAESGKLPTIARVNGAAEVVSIVESMFVLDIDDPETVKRNFGLAGKLLRGDTPLFRLEYPRRYDVLPAVRQAIQQAIKQGAQGV